MSIIISNEDTLHFLNSLMCNFYFSVHDFFGCASEEDLKKRLLELIANDRVESEQHINLFRLDMEEVMDEDYLEKVVNAWNTLQLKKDLNVRSIDTKDETIIFKAAK